MAQEKVFKMLTDEEYAKMFLTFKNKSNEDAIIRNAIIKPIIEKYADKSIDIMSIGAGNGWLEDEIIRHPQMKVKSILAIEPNPEHAKKLQEKSLQWTQTTAKIDQTYFNEKYETVQKFDVILLVHSIYYLDNAIDAIIKLNFFLKSGGQIMIVVDGHQGGYEVASRVYEQMDCVPPIRRLLIRVANGIIAQGLQQNNIKFMLQNGTTLFDVTDFIKKEDTTSCSDVISFFLHTKYEGLDKELQDDIYKIVKERVIVTEDNRQMFPSCTTFINVEKF